MEEVLSAPARNRVPIRFESLVLTEPESLAGRRSATLAASIVLHSLLILAVLILPLLYYDVLPTPGEQIMRAFFVTPPELAPPPPPPPPPPAAARAVPRPAVAPRPVETASFVAPIEVPAEIVPEEGLDLGVEGGVPGGVEGGVPGGVVGGVVGGLPQEAPPPKVVRVGGQLVAPKLVRSVKPVYPPLALQARASAVIIMEAHVDTRGYVKSVKVLRGHPLFDEAALEAVRQWRYKPLLLNGEPTEFILTATIIFNVQQAQEGGQTTG
jgi:protein TonB